jgi:hypothetical protein
VNLTYSTVQGGQYTARQNPNGTWDVFRVPILSAHKRDLGPTFEVKDGEPKVTQNVFKVDSDWLAKAYTKARRRYEQDAYMAPLHIRHHSKGASVEPAGFMLPSEVGPMKYEGRELSTLFADFIQVPDRVYSRIKRGELPYVSVEILDTAAEPEIDSCAIMDHVVPYFKYPLLTIGSEIPYPSVASVNGENAGPVMAYARAGKRASILCYMADSSGLKKHGEDGEDDEDGEKKKKGETGKGPEKKGKPDEGNSFDADKAGEVKTDVTDEAMNEEGGLVDKLLAVFQDFAGKFQSVLSSMMGGGSKPGLPNPTPADQGGSVMAEKKDEKSVSVITTTATTGAPVAAPQVVSWTASTEYASMRGELDAIKSQLANASRDAEIRAKAKTLAGKLAAYAVSEDEIYKLAKDGGDAALAAYEAAIAKHGQKDSSVRFDADATISSDAFPSEVLAYNSPDKVKKAAEYWAAYKAMGRHAGATTLKEFIANCMAMDESHLKSQGKNK